VENEVMLVLAKFLTCWT